MYEIIMRHNRPWTTREVLFFVILFVLVTYVLVRLFKKKRIVLSQVFAGEFLFVFIRTYELTPFWSWWEAASGNLGLLREIVLNIILFLPIGILLPFVFGKKILLRYALLAGISFSFIVECSQLLFCRGLFEWDDIIDNSIGAIIGCIISNQIVQRFGKNRIK